MKRKPAFYECHCGFYHALGYKGGCEDATARFLSEELDELHSEGWQEVFTDQEVEPAPQVVAAPRRKNFNRMMALTPETDVEGNKIEVGCRVRCFSGTYYDSEHDYLMGLDTIGNGSYSEGRVLAIEEHTPLDWHPGIYYLVEMERVVGPLIERTRSNFIITEHTRTTNTAGRSYVIANGNEHPAVRVDENGVYSVDDSEIHKNFAVVRIN